MATVQVLANLIYMGLKVGRCEKSSLWVWQFQFCIIHWKNAKNQEPNWFRSSSVSYYSCFDSYSQYLRQICRIDTGSLEHILDKMLNETSYALYARPDFSPIINSKTRSTIPQLLSLAPSRPSGLSITYVLFLALKTGHGILRWLEQHD
jgi:hypothetical protein